VALAARCVVRGRDVEAIAPAGQLQRDEMPLASGAG
jgi:hypothetical protein